MSAVTEEMVKAGAQGIHEAAVGRQDLPAVPWERVDSGHKQKLNQMSRDCLAAALAGGSPRKSEQCPKCGERPMKGDQHTCLRLPIEVGR